MIDATPLLRLHARRRGAVLAAQNARDVQRVQLLRLLRRAADTRFGRAHEFTRISSVEEFQARVPLRRYEDFWRDWWRDAFPVLTDISWPGKIPFFAATSGTTTGNTKFIPVSRAMTVSNRRAVLDLLTHHLAARPRSRIFGGRNFMLGGSTDLVRQAPGVLSGDLSGIAAETVPAWARTRFFPPLRHALETDWEKKIATLARLSLDADIRSLGGTPSWVLLLFERLAALRPDAPRRVASWYPKLELFVHGGVDFSPYRARFAELFEGSGADVREVYPASEGFVAVADRAPGEGLRLLIDNGIFFEFVPVQEIDAPNPTRHWAGTVETGVNYAIVLSTCAGLWSYVLGDTVRLIDRAPPRLLVTGRLSYMLSAFGEHLIGEELEAAVSAAAAAVGRTVSDWTVTARLPQSGGRGGHLYLVEFDAPPDDETIARFAAALDADLTRRNLDYAAHRSGGFGMDAPTVRAVRPGTFAAWMKRRGMLGGQNKVPRVIRDAALLESLEQVASERESHARPAIPAARAEHFPHGADVGVRGVGPSCAAAFEQAALALTATVAEPDNVRAEREVIIDCEAPSLELLLVDWLNALIYRMAVERMLFVEFHVRIDGLRLHASARGETIDRQRHAPAVEPKGATMTALHVGAGSDGAWTAECVVDV